jgi:hypothetical protein
MKRIGILTAAVLMLLFLATAGCSGDKPAPVPTPTAVPSTETTVATPPPTTATPAPEPVVTLPEKQDVDLALTKDRTYSTISLLYNGGGGELFTNKVEMRVTTSDGKVTDYVMSDGKAPKRGDEIVAQGTRGSDRCEVWVTSAGVRYKIMDQSLILGGAYEGNH